MSDEPEHALRPRRATWTHIALRVNDIDASIAWYERFTHLTLLQQGQDKDGKNAWLGDSTQPDSPFVLVLGQFFEGHDPFAPAAHPPLGPFAHIGIELPTKAAVDEVAARAKAPRPDPAAQADRLRLLREGPRPQHGRILVRPGSVREGQGGLGPRQSAGLTCDNCATLATKS
jgi:catechol 2,3-dioxygenase-like lactoylglutathione lyase family enzyme